MEHPLKNQFDIGVVIGRFQVAELTDGHRHLIGNVAASHKQVLVVVGISPTMGTKKNPLGYIPRMQMLQEAYPNAVIVPFNDMPSDKDWSNNLDKLIRSVFPIGSVCLYGGRDSFIKNYSGIYETKEISEIVNEEATKVREELGKRVLNCSAWRAGAIFQSQNQYPKVFPTVDIAVVTKPDGEWLVLLGKRTPDSKWRFPGGFVGPEDENLEQAALRELHEEFDVEVDPDSIKYVGSNRQDDWRYKGPDEKICTTLFKVDYVYGDGGSISEEFYETKFIPMSIDIDEIEPTHVPLFQQLCKNLKIKKTESVEV